MTKPSQKRKIFTRNKFAEYSYNYVNQPQTTHPPPPNKHAKSFIFTKIKCPTNIINSVVFHDHPHTSQDKSENYPFFH